MNFKLVALQFALIFCAFGSVENENGTNTSLQMLIYQGLETMLKTPKEKVTHEQLADLKRLLLKRLSELEIDPEVQASGRVSANEENLKKELSEKKVQPKDHSAKKRWAWPRKRKSEETIEEQPKRNDRNWRPRLFGTSEYNEKQEKTPSEESNLRENTNLRR